MPDPAPQPPRDPWTTSIRSTKELVEGLGRSMEGDLSTTRNATPPVDPFGTVPVAVTVTDPSSPRPLRYWCGSAPWPEPTFRRVFTPDQLNLAAAVLRVWLGVTSVLGFAYACVVISSSDYLRHRDDWVVPYMSLGAIFVLFYAHAVVFAIGSELVPRDESGVTTLNESSGKLCTSWGVVEMRTILDSPFGYGFYEGFACWDHTLPTGHCKYTFYSKCSAPYVPCPSVYLDSPRPFTAQDPLRNAVMVFSTVSLFGCAARCLAVEWNAKVAPNPARLTVPAFFAMKLGACLLGPIVLAPLMFPVTALWSAIIMIGAVPIGMVLLFVICRECLFGCLGCLLATPVRVLVVDDDSRGIRLPDVPLAQEAGVVVDQSGAGHGGGPAV